MKRLLLICIPIFLYHISFAQNTEGKSDDAARISIASFVPTDIGSLTPTAQEALKGRLDRMITSNGLGGSSQNRFVLTAKVVEMEKEVSSTTPIVYFYNLEITLLIGDVIEGTLFASQVVNVKGIGNSETKAYLNAIKNIKDKDPVYASFLDKGKQKIVEYYNAQCDFIIKEAVTLADAKNYDEAMYKLSSVPQICKDCFSKCMDKVTEIYKAKIEYECQNNIAKATSLMAKEDYNSAADLLSPIIPEMACYAQAKTLIQNINDHKCAVAIGNAKGSWAAHDVTATSAALSSIPSDSKCYPEALSLVNEVKKYVKETENRDFEFMKQSKQDEKEVKLAQIKAARDVGVAYGNNQPKVINRYSIKIRTWY
jgi:hypothetical protein